MTNNKTGEDQSGRFSGSDRVSQLKRNNKSYRSSAIGRYLPTFSKSKTIYTTPSEDTTNYLQIIAHTIDNPTYVVNGIILAIERYHKIGHYDEEVAAQKTAFTNSVIAQFRVIGNLIPMHILHDLLSNPPTDESTATTLGDGTQTNVVVALYDRDTLATIIQDMTNSKIEILPIVVDILKMLFVHVKVKDEEKIGGVYSPGEHVVFGLPKDTLATHTTNLATIVSNKGKFKKYCNFYGVSTKPFSEDMIANYTELNGYTDPKFLEMCKYHMMACRDAAATNKMYHSVTQSFVASVNRFFFKDDPNECIDVLMAERLANTYSAGNNTYGGLLVMLVGTVQDNVPIVEIYQDDATQGAANGFDGKTLTEDNVFRLFRKFASAHGISDATFGIGVTGTDLAADHLEAEPGFLIDNGIVSYGTCTMTIAMNALINWIGDKLGLSAVKKGGK